MKRTFFLCWMIIMVIGANGQITKSYKYFKDVNCYEEVPQSKARYKKIISVSDDGIKTSEIFNIKSGKPVDIRSTTNDHPSGIWKTFDKNGEVIYERNFDKLVYSDVKVKDGLYFEYPQDSKSNLTLDFTPAHFGTQEDHIMYLRENVRYPHESIENSSQGRVMVHIKITAEGNVQVISISNGVDIFLDCESWRVIEIMPKWTPAMKDGVPVDSYTFIPIRFTLAN